MAAHPQRLEDNLVRLNNEITTYRTETQKFVDHIQELQLHNAAELGKAETKVKRDLARQENNRIARDYETQLNNIFAIEKAKEKALDELSRLEAALSEENVKAAITNAEREKIAQKEADLEIARQKNALETAKAKKTVDNAKREKLAEIKMLTEIANLENTQKELNAQLALDQIKYNQKAEQTAHNTIRQAQIKNRELDAQLALKQIFYEEQARQDATTELRQIEIEGRKLDAKLALDQVRFNEQAQKKAENELKQLKLKNKELVANIDAAKLNEYQKITASAENKIQEQRLANIKQIQEAQAAAMATRAQYLDQDNLKELAEASLADMRAQTEKTRLELAVQEKIKHDTTFKAEAIALKRTQKYMQSRLDLNKQVEDALLAEDEDLTTKRGRLIAQRIKNEADAQKADKEVETYLSKIPLIGIKLGQRGNILDAFKDLSKVTDEVTGKVWTFSKASQAWKDATTVTKTTRNAAGQRVQTVDKAASAKRKKQGQALAKGIGKAQKAAARGDAQAQKTMDMVKAYQESQKTLAEAQKAQKEARKSGSTEDIAKADDAVREAKKQVKSQAKAVGRAVGVNGATPEDMEAAEAANAKKATAYNAIANASAIMASLAQKLESQMDAAASMKAKADTRLYGSNMETKYGSYWSKIAFDIAPTMISPFLKEEDLVNNIQTAISKGIAADAEQLGLLETLKDKIAQTFDTFDTTVRRLVRIQDINSTAARMGMEASLNEFLNGMYETTEYLSDIAASVRSSLTEAEALMTGENAVAFEYQVQKWLGSLYSSGVSQSGVSSISDALGKLAAGDIQGIVNGGAGNLLIMAANNANLSISDILADGLDASETNTLLKQMVSYMNDLVSEANGNLVVQQELAKVFGLSASDLKAAAKTMVDTAIISQQGATNTYNAMLGNLFDMADIMWQRTSLGEMMSNIWANVNYATASAMGNNPVLYVLTKVADIMNTFAGGIPIPMISVMGNTVDTKLKISDILQMTSVLGGFTESLIGMFASMGSNGGSGFGSGLLKMVGVGSTNARVRGTKSGKGSSSSGTVSSYSGGGSEDIQEGAKSEGKDKNKQESTAAEEESTEVTAEVLNNNIVNIYNLLSDVVNGVSSLHVNVDPVANGFVI